MNSKTIHSVRTLLVNFIVIFAICFMTTTAQADTMRASWYGPGLQGNPMKNGEPFNMHDPTTVAHKTLPIGTKLLLVNIKNNKQQVVIVKDRGPFVKGRDIDLSKAAAKKLGLKFGKNGTASVVVFRLT